MKINFDFQGVIKSINLKDKLLFNDFASAYKNIRKYAADIINGCEEDISLFLDGKPFVYSNVNYNEISNKLIRIRKNIETGLKGGKGGFGATIKSQKKKINMKEVTVDLCRDLNTGKRIKDLKKTEGKFEKIIKENSTKVKNNNTINSSYENEKSEINDNGIITHYQSHILKLEDKWKNISNSVNFGFENINEEVNV